jgi:hypothetical protein
LRRYGVVAFSELPQVALFGSLFVITLALALLGDLFIPPALLVAGGRFFHPWADQMADAPHPSDEVDERLPAAGRTAPGE